MKITGGYLKGRIYSKKLPNNIRPTSELVREALFNTLSNLIDFNDIYVLDLCAGTGALGLESISRGAKFCHFIEKDGKTCSIIKDIANSLGINLNCFKVTNIDVIKFLKLYKVNSENKYDIIFFDPPYFINLYNNVLSLLAEIDLLNEFGLIVIEYSKKIEITKYKYLKELKQKTYGDTIISIFEKL